MTLVSEQRDSEIQELKARVAALEDQVARLEENSVEKVIVLREITKEEAKAEIMDSLRRRRDPLLFRHLRTAANRPGDGHSHLPGVESGRSDTSR